MLAATAGGEERKVTAMELQHMRRKGKKISMITAYDYPSVITIL
jgi:ketopantoate hydroxymethyltransferase